MQAKIEQRIENKGAGVYCVYLVVYDDYGDMIIEYERDFTKANEVYAGYKSLQYVARRLSDFGVTGVDIESSSKAITRELKGELNNNSSLLRYTLERFAEFGVEILKTQSN